MIVGGRVVVVEEKVLHPLTEVEFQPLGQVLRFVAEDGADCHGGWAAGQEASAAAAGAISAARA